MGGCTRVRLALLLVAVVRLLSVAADGVVRFRSTRPGVSPRLCRRTAALEALDGCRRRFLAATSLLVKLSLTLSLPLPLPALLLLPCSLLLLL